MDYDSKNVLVGVGVLKVDDASIGYTSGGVKIQVASDKVEAECDQAYTPVKIFKVREKVSIVTQLAELTLSNLKLAWEQKAEIDVVPAAEGVEGTSTLKWGMNDKLVEHTLEFEGVSPNGFKRTFKVLKAVIFETGETNMIRDGISLIPVTFRVLPDVAQPAGEEYGEIIDVDAAALPVPPPVVP